MGHGIVVGIIVVVAILLLFFLRVPVDTYPVQSDAYICKDGQLYKAKANTMDGAMAVAMGDLESVGSAFRCATVADERATVSIECRNGEPTYVCKAQLYQAIITGRFVMPSFNLPKVSKTEPTTNVGPTDVQPSTEQPSSDTEKIAEEWLVTDVPTKPAPTKPAEITCDDPTSIHLNMELKAETTMDSQSVCFGCSDINEVYRAISVYHCKCEARERWFATNDYSKHLTAEQVEARKKYWNAKHGDITVDTNGEELS